MKLRPVERLMTNSPLRGLSQIYIEAPAMRKMARRDKYPLCLEVGCGRGLGARLIIEKFGAERVVATDIDPEQLKRARKNIEKSPHKDKVELKVEDAMALDEPDNKFDAVFCFGVIHHTEDWRKAIREIARVLKPGGEFFFMEPLRTFVRIFEGGAMRAIAEHPSGGEFSYEEITDALSSSGLEPTGSRRFDGLIMIGAARKQGGANGI